MLVWNSLTSVHRARRFGSRLQLRRNFITASMKEGQAMESWIGEVQGLANQLKAIDVDVSDEDMIVVLTAGLPTSYTPIAISFNALESTKLTLDFVITCLLNEEGHQTVPSFTSVNVKTEDSDVNTALNISKFRSDIQCFYCLLKGHYSSVCPQKEKDTKAKEDEGRKQVQVKTSNSAAVADIDEDYAFTAVSDEENIAL